MKSLSTFTEKGFRKLELIIPSSTFQLSALIQDEYYQKLHCSTDTRKHFRYFKVVRKSAYCLLYTKLSKNKGTIESVFNVM